MCKARVLAWFGWRIYNLYVFMEEVLGRIFLLICFRKFEDGNILFGKSIW
jgi:hypothetical protein